MQNVSEFLPVLALFRLRLGLLILRDRTSGVLLVVLLRARTEARSARFGSGLDFVLLHGELKCRFDCFNALERAETISLLEEIGNEGVVLSRRQRRLPRLFISLFPLHYFGSLNNI